MAQGKSARGMGQALAGYVGKSVAGAARDGLDRGQIAAGARRRPQRPYFSEGGGRLAPPQTTSCGAANGDHR